MKGVGIQALGADGTTYACGGRHLAKRFGVRPVHDLMLFENSRLTASLSYTDELRPDAATAISELHRLGLKVSIVSGDTAERCTAVAEALGIDSFLSEQLPEQKLLALRKLQEKENFAYVGDGINDAPTLAEASVGVSLSSASDIALQSAQVVLTNGSLVSVARAIVLSRLTVRTIKQNLFWAFAYNVAMIPLAGLGFFSPIWAALFMSLSDVVIIGNSLKLRYRKLG
jgi:Cu+-exporting ATPase